MYCYIMGSLHLSFHGPGIYTIWSSFLNLLGQLEPNLAVMMFVRSFTKVLIFSWSGFKKMATMDHSWFWLIETLIIFSEATIPNSLLVCTNNLRSTTKSFQFILIWWKYDHHEQYLFLGGWNFEIYSPQPTN